MMRLKSHSLRSWLVRIVVMVTLLAILLLNIRVLTRENSQSEEEETAMLNNQLLPATPLKANGRRNLKQSQVSADDYKVQSSINDSQAVNGPNVKNTHSDIRVNSPISQPRNCGQPHCKEFLRGSEILAMNKCSMETSKRTVNGKLGQEQESELKENDCHFMNGSSTRLPVALASTSGSGNTWIRGLLERATGICTGFLYCDYAMRREGFIGETVKSGNVLVVKTHTISPKWYGTRGPYMDDPYYGAAVYILRNPYKSMIAEWNRKVTYDMLRLPHNESHTNVVQKKFWRKCMYIYHACIHVRHACIPIMLCCEWLPVYQIVLHVQVHGILFVLTSHSYQSDVYIGHDIGLQHHHACTHVLLTAL